MPHTYGNGVKRERIEEPGYNLKTVALETVRQGNGNWSTTLHITGKILIDGNRRLDVDRVVHLNLKQTGRKPQPNKKVK